MLLPLLGSTTSKGVSAPFRELANEFFFGDALMPRRSRFFDAEDDLDWFFGQDHFPRRPRSATQKKHRGFFSDDDFLSDFLAWDPFAEFKDSKEKLPTTDQEMKGLEDKKDKETVNSSDVLSTGQEKENQTLSTVNNMAAAVPRKHFGALETKVEDNKWTLEVACPGSSKEDVEVFMKNNRILTVRGKRRMIHSNVDNGEEGDKNTLRAYSYGSFERQFPLPADVLPDSIVCDFDQDNATLKVTFDLDVAHKDQKAVEDKVDNVTKKYGQRIPIKSPIGATESNPSAFMG